MGDRSSQKKAMLLSHSKRSVPIVIFSTQTVKIGIKALSFTGKSAIKTNRIFYLQNLSFQGFKRPTGISSTHDFPSIQVALALKKLRPSFQIFPILSAKIPFSYHYFDFQL
jgi:hypothetical protein